MKFFKRILCGALVALSMCAPSFSQEVRNPGSAGGGGGTVTTVTSGNAAPLFTVGIANATSTPAISFTLSNAAVGTFLGNPTASAAAPSYTTLSAINPETATYQVTALDFAAYKTISVASGTFVTTLVASGAQPSAGQYITILNYGSGVITIARSGQNINNAAGNLTLNAGSATAPTSAEIWSDGANYFASVNNGGGGGSGTVTNIATTGPITGGPITSTGTIACATCGVTGSPLSQFASTTSAQFFGVISDETGTGAVVGANTPTLVTPVIGAATGTSLAASGGVSSQTNNLCADSSGSGTAQVCNTVPATFTVATDSCFTYTTTTTNSGTGLTVNANSLGAKSVAIPGGSGWTTTLGINIIPANKPLLLCYDGTNLNAQQTGTTPAGSGTVTASGSPGATSVPGFTSGTNIAPIANESYDATGLIGNMNPALFGKSVSGFSPVCYVGNTYTTIQACVVAQIALGVTGTGVIYSFIPEDISYPTYFNTSPKWSGTIYLGNDLGAAAGATCTQTPPYTCWLVDGPLILPSKFSIRSLAGSTTVLSAVANPGGVNSGSIISFNTTNFPAPIGSMTGAGATLGTPSCAAGSGSLHDGVYNVVVGLVNNLMAGNSTPLQPGRGPANIPTDEKTVTCSAGTTNQAITWAITNAPARVTTGYGAQDAAAYITCVSGTCASQTGIVIGGSQSETEAGDPSVNPTGCSTATGLIDQDGGACRLPASTGTLTFTINGNGSKLGGPPPPYNNADQSNPMVVLGTGPDTGNSFDTDVRDVTLNCSPGNNFASPPANTPDIAILGYTAQEHSGTSGMGFYGACTHNYIYSGLNSNNSTHTRVNAGSSTGPATGSFITAVADGRMLSGGAAIEFTGTFAAHCSGSATGTCGASRSGLVNPSQILVTGPKAFPAIHGHAETTGAGAHGVQITDGASATIDGFDAFSSSATTQIDASANHVHVCVHDDTGAAGNVMIFDSANSFSVSTVNGFESDCYDSGTTYAGNGVFAGAVTTNSATNVCGTSSPCLGGVEGATGPTPTSGDDFLFYSSTNHCAEGSYNGGALGCIPLGPTTAPTSGHVVLWGTNFTQTDGGAPGGSALSSVTAAIGTATIASGNNPIIWNWAQTTNTQNAFAFGETSAATSGTLTNGLANQTELQVSTASASTAAPLSVKQGSVTGTVAFPALQVQSTWNNASLVGQFIFGNVTNTSSGAGSELINLQVGNTPEFTVSPTGLAVFGAGTVPTIGTAGGEVAIEGTAFTGASTNYGWYNDSTLHCLDIIDQTTNIGCAVGESSIIAANTIPKATGTTSGITGSSITDNGVTVSTVESIVLGTAGNVGITDKTVGFLATAMGAQTTATCTNVTGMTWNLAANKNYVLECKIPMTLAATATIQYCIGGPGTATSYSLIAEGDLGTAGIWSQISTLAQTAYGTKTNASAAVAANTVQHVWAGIQNGATASGTALTLQTAANGTNAITVGANATCSLTQVN